MKPDIPIHHYRRENTLPIYLFSCNFYVWEGAEETPMLWTFYEESQTLKIEIKAEKKYYKWSILPHSKLLCITEKDHANTTTDELNYYEMWGYKTADYFKLKSVSGQLIYMVKEDIVVNSYASKIPKPTANLLEIEHTSISPYRLLNNTMGCSWLLAVYVMYIIFSELIHNFVTFFMYVL